MEFRVDARRAPAPNCLQCGSRIEEGYSWQAYGERITLCNSCAQDIHESVRSFGDEPEAANRRFLDRLRRLIEERT
jgi:hypothetical protein